MAYRIFSIPIPSEGGEEELNRFLAGHRVASVRTQWVTRTDGGGAPGPLWRRRSGMKRLGGVFEEMCSFLILERAFALARRGKGRRQDVELFAERLEENLGKIREELLEGRFRFGGYRFFEVVDPKRRTIAVAPVAERVVHHAIILVCGGRLERGLVDKAYACRKGKGQWQAVAEAARLAGTHGWCLKLDVRRFFDSIDHARMLEALARKVKDRRMQQQLGVPCLLPARSSTRKGIRANHPVSGSAPRRGGQRAAMPRPGLVGGWPTATGAAAGYWRRPMETGGTR